MFQKGNSLLHLYASFPFDAPSYEYFSYNNDIPILSSAKKIPVLEYLLSLDLSLLEAENDVS